MTLLYYLYYIFDLSNLWFCFFERNVTSQEQRSILKILTSFLSCAVFDKQLEIQGGQHVKFKSRKHITFREGSEGS